MSVTFVDDPNSTVTDAQEMLISITETWELDQYPGQKVHPQKVQAWTNSERRKGDLQSIQID
eukprot:8916845-Pyramimonas_sp.AAC.1